MFNIDKILKDVTKEKAIRQKEFEIFAKSEGKKIETFAQYLISYTQSNDTFMRIVFELTYLKKLLEKKSEK